MDLYKIRNELSNGKTIFDLSLKVTFYARVSTEKDAQLNSLDNQVFYYKDYIKNNKNWHFVNGYVDEGITGTSALKRDSFLKMIKDAKQKKFDLILTKEISRFSRNTLDSIKYTQELLSYGVGVLFQSDNINTILPDSELRLTIMASVAQEEVRKLSERVRFGMKRSIEKSKVLGNNSICGYIKDNGKLVVVENEAKMIRELFSLYATGKYGFKAIANILYDKGYRSSKGTKIIASSLQRMLLNPKYKGYYCTNTVRKMDYRNSKQERIPRKDWIVYECSDVVPPIVSKELWNKANEIYEARSTSLKNRINGNTAIFQNRYAFTGLLHCIDHPNDSFYRIAGNKRRANPVWICSVYNKKGKKECDSPKLLESELYRTFKYLLSNFIENKDIILNDLLEKYKSLISICKYDTEIHKLQKDVDNLEIKKDKLLELVINTYITNEEFKTRNEKINAELQTIYNKLKKINQSKKEIHNSEKELEKIQKEISKELTFEKNESIDNLIHLLVDKVIVSKINNNKHIKLDIYYKLGKSETVTLNLNKSSSASINFKHFSNSTVELPKKCQSGSHNENNDSNCCT